MKRTLLLALVSVLLVTSSALYGADFTGRVTAVPDGDTITVRTADGQKHRVRLDGIDAPERTQPYSQLSRKNLIALIGEQPVTVVSDKVDRHGRPVGVVRNAAGHDVALEQLKRAWRGTSRSTNTSNHRTIARLTQQRRQSLGQASLACGAIQTQRRLGCFERMRSR